MKLPQRSFAYFWTKSTLNWVPPTWTPLLGVGIAVLAGALWVSQERKWSSLLVVPACSLVGAAESWRMRGMRDIFAEQERLLKKARGNQNA